MAGGQANVEYFFRLLYSLIYGREAVFNYAAFLSLLAHIWTWIIAIGYAISVLAIGLLIYELIKLFELRKREEHFYHTLIVQPQAKSGANARWAHIEKLAGGESASEWREAIVEADIMLDEVLAGQGYVGATVADKLKTASFGTVQDAWEAHKVRNQIAHEGSAFDLSESVARRTLARFESVFREFNAI